LNAPGSPGARDELYRINVTTGAASDLGSTGVTGIAGSAFVGGQMDLFQYGQGTNYIYAAPDGCTAFGQGAALGAQIVDGGVPSPFSTATSVPTPASVPEPPGRDQRRFPPCHARFRGAPQTPGA